MHLDKRFTETVSRPKSHSSIAVVERASAALGSTVDSVTYTLKPLKQKLFVDGLVYLLQEIYGIENKNITPHVSPATGTSDRRHS